MSRLQTSQPSLSLSLSFFPTHTHTHYTRTHKQTLLLPCSVNFYAVFSFFPYSLSLPLSLSLSLHHDRAFSLLLILHVTFQSLSMKHFHHVGLLTFRNSLYPSFADKSKLHLSSNFLFTFCHISVFQFFF